MVFMCSCGCPLDVAENVATKISMRPRWLHQDHGACSDGKNPRVMTIYFILYYVILYDIISYLIISYICYICILYIYTYCYLDEGKSAQPTLKTVPVLPGDEMPSPPSPEEAMDQMGSLFFYRSKFKA